MGDWRRSWEDLAYLDQVEGCLSGAGGWASAGDCEDGGGGEDRARFISRHTALARAWFNFSGPLPGTLWRWPRHGIYSSVACRSAVARRSPCRRLPRPRPPICSATMEQIRKVANAGADLVRCAVPREEGRRGTEDDRRRIADPGDPRHPLHSHPGAEGDRCRRELHPPQPGQHWRPREARRGGGEGDRAGVPMRIGVNSAPCRNTCMRSSAKRQSRRWSQRHRVRRADGGPRLRGLQISIKSTNVPNTIAVIRLLAAKVPYPLHLGITEAGTKWLGSLKSAVGLVPARRRGRRHDPDQPLTF